MHRLGESLCLLVLFAWGVGAVSITGGCQVTDPLIGVTFSLPSQFLIPSRSFDYAVSPCGAVEGTSFHVACAALPPAGVYQLNSGLCYSLGGGTSVVTAPVGLNEPIRIAFANGSTCNPLLNRSVTIEISCGETDSDKPTIVEPSMCVYVISMRAPGVCPATCARDAVAKVCGGPGRGRCEAGECVCEGGAFGTACGEGGSASRTPRPTPAGLRPVKGAFATAIAPPPASLPIYVSAPLTLPAAVPVGEGRGRPLPGGEGAPFASILSCFLLFLFCANGCSGARGGGTRRRRNIVCALALLQAASGVVGMGWHWYGDSNADADAGADFRRVVVPVAAVVMSTNQTAPVAVAQHALAYVSARARRREQLFRCHQTSRRPLPLLLPVVHQMQCFSMQQLDSQRFMKRICGLILRWVLKGAAVVWALQWSKRKLCGSSSRCSSIVTEPSHS